MAASSYPLRPGEADCRDYLRTGRCKYGESCKYNHPLNVESGGGVKAAPGQPLFPVRPMEPVCQYFLKHGTCKFGQACKFNHPSGSPLVDSSGGLPAGQLVFVTANNGITNSNVQASSSVQVLPQRPTEPNCIYFLKNGSCKYGATCKFHHPLDVINNNNRNNNSQVQLVQPTVIQRDRSNSLSSAGSLRAQQQMQLQQQYQQQQQNITYGHATANVTYVQQQQQPQRLQTIPQRAMPVPQQQATHILLPDGQIAVILDPQSLQNVSELNAQDRPKFYLSQTDGSIGTLPSMDQQKNSQHFMVSSPMLTATTTSTSNHTFDSRSFGDLVGTNVQVAGGPQCQQIPTEGPHKYGSGGSLSAYGSVDSGTYDDVTPRTGSHALQHQMNGPSLPQFSAWPVNQQGQAQAQRPPSGAEAQQRQAGNTEDAGYFWPSNGSLTSINEAHQQQQAGQAYVSMPNSNPQVSSYGAVGGQAIRRSYSNNSQGDGPPQNGGEEEKLSRMTSALLTMMDHPNSHEHAVAQNRSHSQSESSLSARSSPMRSPPGMTNQIASHMMSPPDTGGGYFVGGYDQQATNNNLPPWAG